MLRLKRLVRRLRLKWSGHVRDGSVESLLYEVLCHRARAPFLAHLRLVGLNEAEIQSMLTVYDLSQRHAPRPFRQALKNLSHDVLDALPIEVESTELRREQTAHAARFAAYLRGKSVVLTGPAPHVVGAGRGALIEASDVVVRMNFQWPIAPQLAVDLGERLDVLYHCCNGDFPVERLFVPALSRARFVLMEQGLHSRRLMRHCRTIGVPSLYISQTYLQLQDDLGVLPTTGLVAVKHLLSFPLASLQTVGMTFATTGYYPSYLGHGNAAVMPTVGRSGERHHPLEELRFAQRLARLDPRLKLEPEALKR